MTGQPHKRHFTTEEKFKRFLRNQDAFTVNICDDVDLYLRAHNWNIDYLKIKFVQDMRERPVEIQCEFINKIPLENSEDASQREHRNNPVMEYLLNLLKFAPTAILRKIDINPAVSPSHSNLYDCHQDMLRIRNDMSLVEKTYHPPHLVLALGEKDKDFCFAKYFSGNKWSQIQLNEQIRSFVPDLQPNKCAVVGEELWFIHEDTLYNVSLFRESKIHSYIIPRHRELNIQLCSNGNGLILLAQGMRVAEVYNVQYSDYKFKISKWYSLTQNEFSTIVSNDSFDLYNIQLRKQQRPFRACLAKSQGSLFGVNENLYKYILNCKQFNQNKHDISIPSSGEKGNVCVLVARQNIEHYLFRMFKVEQDFKRKHSDTDCSGTSNAKKLCMPTVRCRSIGNGKEDECIDFQQLTI